MNRKTFFLLVLSFVLLPLLTAQAQTTSGRIAFTGTAPDLSGPQDLTFILYDADTGGTAFYMDSQTVDVTTQPFPAVLGAGNGGDVPATIFAASPSVFIATELTSTPGAEIAPRVPIHSSGYARNAVTLGNSVFTDASGNVGVGTGTPEAQLHLNESAIQFNRPQLHISGGRWNPDDTEGDLKIGSATHRLKIGVAIDGAGAGDVRIRAQGGTNRLMIGAGTNDALTIVGNGNVGIGTTTPGFPLEVVAVSTLAVPIVRAITTNGVGVLGQSTNSNGVVGQSTNGVGVIGSTSNPAQPGVSANSANGLPANLGLQVSGRGSFTGIVSKPAGSFKIDHPLEPANKYLYHSFVESPDMMNIYNGNAILDTNGEAWVELPKYFDALNRDFRYSLTAIGAPGPNLYVAEEVSSNHFKIAGGKSRGKVSWQVTGVRKDPFAEKYRITVEEEKPAAEWGYYLYPDLYGQPETKGVQWARDPDGMKRMLEARERFKETDARTAALP